METRSRAFHVRDAGARGANSLTFLRLVLASAVILAHTAPLGGFGAAMPRWIGWVAEWAVNGFFVISGFLIAGSRMTTPFGPFMWNRALRIFPGYWTVQLAVAAIFAPVTSFFSGEHYGIRSAASYLLNNSMLLINQWGIDGTLAKVPFPGAWNGSLWTLFYEFWAYLGAGAILSLAVIRRRPGLWVSGMLLAILVIQAWAGHVLGAADASWHSALRLAAFFLAGMVLYFSPRLLLSTPIAILALVLEIGLLRTGLVNLFGQLPFAYLLLWFGARVPIRIGSTNDISYGVYVYAFPVQQSLALAGGAVLGAWWFASLSLVLTIPLAWLSWTLVERRAMRYRMRSGRAAAAPNRAAAVDNLDTASAAV